MCVLPLPKHWVLTFALIGCAVVTQRVCDTEIQGLSQQLENQLVIGPSVCVQKREHL